MSDLHKIPSTGALFGGEIDWKSEGWTNSDDQVRGGKSHSSLQCEKKKAVFKGILDIDTLGGAGFASQRTVGEDKEWDLSGFDGIELALDAKHSDTMRYTFILKDELLPRDSNNGREQSTVSWEYDFVAPAGAGTQHDHDAKVFIPWKSFTATYRGKERKDVKELDLAKIKRFTIMMRSFFGTQEGEFQLTLVSISARKDNNSPPTTPNKSNRLAKVPCADDESTSGGSSIKPKRRQSSERRSAWRWFLGKCGKL